MAEEGQDTMMSTRTAPAPALPAEAARARRPVEVTILAGLLLAQGLLFLLVESARTIAAIAAEAIAEKLSLEELALARATAATAALIFVLVGAALIVLGVATLRGMSWARILIQLAEALLLAGELVAYLNGEANYLEMALAVAIVWYLNRRPVREAFARRRGASVVEGAPHG